MDENAKRISLIRRFLLRCDRMFKIRNRFLNITVKSAIEKANMIKNGARAELIRSSEDIIGDWMGSPKSQYKKMSVLFNDMLSGSMKTCFKIAIGL